VLASGSHWRPDKAANRWSRFVAMKSRETVAGRQGQKSVKLRNTVLGTVTK
jgi:hypothetical protein